MAYERHRYGTVASLADGGTIAHGLGVVPTLVNVTPGTAGTIVSVTVTATTITVALKTFSYALGTLSLVAAASQKVFWEAAA